MRPSKWIQYLAFTLLLLLPVWCVIVGHVSWLEAAAGVSWLVAGLGAAIWHNQFKGAGE